MHEGIGTSVSKSHAIQKQIQLSLKSINDKIKIVQKTHFILAYMFMKMWR